MNQPVLFKSKEAWWYAIHISLGMFNNAYCFTELNSSIENVKASLNWEDGSIYVPIAHSIVMLGYLISNFAILGFSNRFGRRGSMILEHSLVIVGSLMSIIPLTPTVIVGRALKGLGAGGFFTICAPFINEISPDALAGKLGSLVCVSCVFGLAFSTGLSLFLPSQSYSTDPLNNLWMLNLGFPGIVSLYCLYYFLFIQKLDSPAWYLSNKRRPEALKALSLVYTAEGIQTGLDRFELRRTEPFLELKEKEGYFSFICRKRNRKMVRLAVLLTVFKQFTGINVVLAYSTRIFWEVSGDEFNSRLISFGITVVNIFSSLFGLVLLDWFGRKTLILIGQGGLGLLLILFALFSFYEVGTAGLATCMFLYIFVASPTIGSAYWAFLSETVNDIGISLVCVTNTLITFVFMFVFEWTIEAFTISGVFSALAVGSFIGVWYALWDVFETKGKKKVEIDDSLYN